MAGIGSNTLRTVLKEHGWSHSKLVAELRRQAAAAGEALPKTESLLTLVSRWVNNHQQPDDFYRDLLTRALDRPAAELFGNQDHAAELEAGAEPWRLARVLELSSIGAGALEAIELAVSDLVDTSGCAGSPAMITKSVPRSELGPATGHTATAWSCSSSWRSPPLPAPMGQPSTFPFQQTTGKKKLGQHSARSFRASGTVVPLRSKAARAP